MPPKISLCMIVRNEEANLSACLATVAGLAKESVIVDTGSTDRTREIAVTVGAKVIDFPWIDDFSAARTRRSAMPLALGSFRSMRTTGSMKKTVVVPYSFSRRCRLKNRRERQWGF